MQVSTGIFTNTVLCLATVYVHTYMPVTEETSQINPYKVTFSYHNFASSNATLAAKMFTFYEIVVHSDCVQPTYMTTHNNLSTTEATRPWTRGFTLRANLLQETYKEHTKTQTGYFSGYAPVEVSLKARHNENKASVRVLNAHVPCPVHVVGPGAVAGQQDCFNRDTEASALLQPIVAASRGQLQSIVTFANHFNADSGWKASPPQYFNWGSSWWSCRLRGRLQRIRRWVQSRAEHMSAVGLQQRQQQSTVRSRGRVHRTPAQTAW